METNVPVTVTLLQEVVPVNFLNPALSSLF